MKKFLSIITIVVLIVLAVGLTACGESNENDIENNANDTSVEQTNDENPPEYSEPNLFADPRFVGSWGCGGFDISYIRFYEDGTGIQSSGRPDPNEIYWGTYDGHLYTQRQRDGGSTVFFPMEYTFVDDDTIAIVLVGAPYFGDSDNEYRTITLTRVETDD